MADEQSNEADLGAFMQQVEEPYIDEPGENVQGLYNLKASNLIPTERAKHPLALGGRHSYDYVPKYIVRAAEEEIEKHYNPEAKVFMAEPISKTYQRNGQKIEYEEEPIIQKDTSEQKAKMEAAIAALPPTEVQAKAVRKEPAKVETIVVPQPTGIIEKPIGAFTAPTREERLKAMLSEIERLKKEQQELRKIREAKIQGLKAKWNSITEGIKAKHPYITALVEKAIRSAPGVARAALGAGKSFAQGIGNLAAKIADPYQRQGIVNQLDYYTAGFTPEGQYQNPIDRINGIPFRPSPLQAQQPQAIRPMQVTNNDLEKEAERLRLERSILTQKAQLANQKAILTGKAAPYPTVPTYTTHERRSRRKSLREIVSEIEKTKLQKELEREKRLATA